MNSNADKTYKALTAQKNIRPTDKIWQDRQNIRTTLRKKRQQLSPTACLQASLEINHYIANTPWFRRSQRIAFYQATHNELDLTYLTQRAWAMGKTCYLPICHPLHYQTLLFAPYFPDETLRRNRYGILEPHLGTHHFCKPFALDLVFVPFIAFDKQGNRLGSGKGYYDRTFAYLQRSSHLPKPRLIGLGYTFQEVPQIPAQSWDVPLNKIIVVNA